jgi:hypothetical protein
MYVCLEFFFFLCLYRCWIELMILTFTRTQRFISVKLLLIIFKFKIIFLSWWWMITPITTGRITWDKERIRLFSSYRSVDHKSLFIKNDQTHNVSRSFSFSNISKKISVLDVTLLKSIQQSVCLLGSMGGKSLIIHLVYLFYAICHTLLNKQPLERSISLEVSDKSLCFFMHYKKKGRRKNSLSCSLKQQTHI